MCRESVSPPGAEILKETGAVMCVSQPSHLHTPAPQLYPPVAGIDQPRALLLLDPAVSFLLSCSIVLLLRGVPKNL